MYETIDLTEAEKAILLDTASSRRAKKQIYSKLILAPSVVWRRLKSTSKFSELLYGSKVQIIGNGPEFKVILLVPSNGKEASVKLKLKGVIDLNSDSMIKNVFWSLCHGHGRYELKSSRVDEWEGIIEFSATLKRVDDALDVVKQLFNELADIVHNMELSQSGSSFFLYPKD